MFTLEDGNELVIASSKKEAYQTYIEAVGQETGKEMLKNSGLNKEQYVKKIKELPLNKYVKIKEGNWAADKMVSSWIRQYKDKTPCCIASRNY